jgi:hypothetical protein
MRHLTTLFMSSGPIVRAPAAKAALIQGLSLLFVLSSVWLVRHFGIVFSIVEAAFLQGVVAALMTWKVRLAPWWYGIQFFFPMALLATNSLHLPPVIFLLIFIFLLATYWSTFRTQVPFYPSGPAVSDAVAQLLPTGRVRMIDIGSGLGGLVLKLARSRPDAQFFGIELAPLPWLLSTLRARLSSNGCRFVRGDYELLDFGVYDVVFAYLSPAAMGALWVKAEREMRPGSMLISYEFLIHARTPDQTIVAKSMTAALYVWYF